MGSPSPYLSIKERGNKMKTLEKLFDKAMKTGYANINGRRKVWGYVQDLESKYMMNYDHETGDFELYHWGTLIVKIGSLKASKPIVKEFYGESKSDRDALCWLFNHLGLSYYAKYRPSIDEFSVYADFGTGVEESRTV